MPNAALRTVTLCPSTRRRRAPIALLAGAVLASAGSAMAQPAGPGGLYFWASPENGDWFNPMGWSYAPTPGVGPPNALTTAQLGWYEPYSVSLLGHASGDCHHLVIGGPSATLRIAALAGSVATLNTHGTELNNDGQILLGGAGATGTSRLIINNHCTLRHAGVLRMDPEGDGQAILGSAFDLGYVLIHAAPHVIEGAGEIRVRLQNDSLVHANIAGKQIIFGGFNQIQNNGVIRASGGGSVRLAISTSFDVGFAQSAQGEIVAANSSSVVLFSAGAQGLSGGTLRTEGSGVFAVIAQGFPLQGVTLAAGSRIVAVSNAGMIVGPAGLTNHGLINLGSVGFLASRVGQSATLSGSGRLQLEGGQLGVFLDGFSYALVNAPDHTIGGAGSLQANLTNLGTIAADRNGLPSGPALLQFSQAPKANHGLIVARNTGQIEFLSTPLTQGPTGVLRAEDGSSIQLNSMSVTGGRLQSQGSGVIFAGGSGETFDAVTIDPGSRVLVPCGRTLNLAGAVINHGNIRVDNSGCGPSFATLAAPAGAFIGGAGEVRLERNSVSPSATLSGNGGDASPLALGSDQRLTGAGTLSGSIRVQGTLAPDQPFSPASPAGAMTVAAGARLRLTPSAEYACDLVSPGVSDRLDGPSSAQVTLAGSLALSTTGEFVPANGAQFDVISGPTIAGAFDAVTGADLPVGRLWVVTQPTRVRVVACYADTNRDGVLDPDDLADCIAGFFAEPPGDQADFNRDGTVDPDDLADAIAAYFLGCG